MRVVAPRPHWHPVPKLAPFTASPAHCWYEYSIYSRYTASNSDSASNSRCRRSDSNDSWQFSCSVLLCAASLELLALEGSHVSTQDHCWWALFGSWLPQPAPAPASRCLDSPRAARRARDRSCWFHRVPYCTEISDGVEGEAGRGGGLLQQLLRRAVEEGPGDRAD